MKQDKKTEERKYSDDPPRELAAFLKESRRKSALHNFLGIAAKSYIDGMQAAIKCQNAAQTAI